MAQRKKLETLSEMTVARLGSHKYADDRIETVINRMLDFYESSYIFAKSKPLEFDIPHIGCRECGRPNNLCCEYLVCKVCYDKTKKAPASELKAMQRVMFRYIYNKGFCDKCARVAFYLDNGGICAWCRLRYGLNDKVIPDKYDEMIEDEASP